MRYFVLLIFMPFFSSSIEYNLQLKAKILMLHPTKKHIVLNIGRVDGIMPKNIVKIYQYEQFIAEGICLVSLEEQSEWIIHYAYRLDELQLDALLDVFGPYREGKKVHLENFDEHIPYSILSPPR